MLKGRNRFLGPVLLGALWMAGSRSRAGRSMLGRWNRGRSRRGWLSSMFGARRASPWAMLFR